MRLSGCICRLGFLALSQAEQKDRQTSDLLIYKNERKMRNLQRGVLTSPCAYSLSCRIASKSGRASFFWPFCMCTSASWYICAQAKLLQSRSHPFLNFSVIFVHGACMNNLQQRGYKRYSSRSRVAWRHVSLKNHHLKSSCLQLVALIKEGAIEPRQLLYTNSFL